jgi:actin-related protein
LLLLLLLLRGCVFGCVEAKDEKAELKKQAAEQKVIVIDHGSGSIKVGWSGEDAPRAVIPTVLYDNHGAVWILCSRSNGLPDSSDCGSVCCIQPLPASIIDAQTESNDYLVGHEALALAQAAGSNNHSNASGGGGGVILTTPIERGLVPDWEQLSKVWDHVWRKELGVEYNEYPVLVSVPPLAPKEMRAELAKRLFAKKVPALVIANSAVLSLFASGRYDSYHFTAVWAVPMFVGGDGGIRCK